MVKVKTVFLVWDLRAQVGPNAYETYEKALEAAVQFASFYGRPITFFEATEVTPDPDPED